ncbi:MULTISPECIES: chaplin family protein [unclassified Nocardiopsis]|uniref:chaplin family protein n=1 Tax=unclassified Nocardiopsis TaxID=2649073 RepID=UPI001356BA81|nr:MULTISPECIES: chaplin family protein [unclassified Nocardiopsis]
MRNTLRYSFATVMTAGLVVAPVAASFADTSTSGSGGIGSGNQIVVPVDVEADLCGNSIAVLGISKATCTQVSEVLYEASGKGGGTTTDGSGGVASGNQIVVPVDAAIDACGNSASVGGVSEAECVEVVEALEEESADGPRTTTDGSGGVASGNQIVVPVDAAINICGNSIAVLGASSAKCTTIINIIQASPENEGGGTSTSGSGGIGSGNQVVVPVDAAVNICGNAVSVLGLAEASCLELISEEEKPGGSEGPREDDENEGTDSEEEKPGGSDGDDSEGPREDDKNEGGDQEEGASGTGDDKPAPEQRADEQLAVTGGALAGLVAAGVAAVGAGGAGLYFARKRRTAAAAPEATEE